MLVEQLGVRKNALFGEVPLACLLGSFPPCSGREANGPAIVRTSFAPGIKNAGPRGTGGRTEQGHPSGSPDGGTAMEV